MRHSLGSRGTALLVAATLSTILVACGGTGSTDPSTASRAAEASIAAPTETAADGSPGGNYTNGTTATVEMNGETLAFSGQICLGPPDNFAFIGFSADNTGSLEIQATTDASQQKLRLVVDEVFLGGEISTIDVGNLHASGSATLDDGTMVDFEVSCAQ